MNKTSIVFRAGYAAVIWLTGGLWAMPVRAGLPTGEAVVAAMTGQAQARVFAGPVHEGRTEVKDLYEGASVGETSRIMTGKDGRLCLVCSPGAILCVAPNTEFTIQQLRHTAEGLPQSGADLIRRIHLDLHKGRLRVHAGVPTATLDIQVETSAGSVAAQGGSFIVAQDERGVWHVSSEAYDQDVIPRGNDRAVLKAGTSIHFAGSDAGSGMVVSETAGEQADLYQFELCSAFFQDLEPFVLTDRPFDRQGLGEYLGFGRSLSVADDGALVTDVSPSIRPSVVATLPGNPPHSPDAGSGMRWTEQRIWKWFDEIGPVKGVNFIPRTAVNSVEMWMKDTFDPQTIDQELGWAHDAGYTAIRVQLQYAVWRHDPDGFRDRMEQLLRLAAKHGLRVVPVLFDDLNLAGQAPEVGTQLAPVPGVYNARWVPSPAPQEVKSRTSWPELEEYVKDMVGKFRRDQRVLYWDLYNTAGNSGLGEETLPLMDQAFGWAREQEPSQPLAVPAWNEFGSAMTAHQLERSDLVTFHSFDTAEGMEARIQLLQRYQRPIICSDWLRRQTGCDFKSMLPIFAANGVGWFNQGLVNGKTQMGVQQEQYRSAVEPELWQQDVLKADGTPYNAKELDLIQGFRYLDVPNR